MSSDGDRERGAGGAAARAAAITALSRWLRAGAFPSRTLSGATPFAVELVQGVLRNLTALDFALDRFCRKPPAPPARAALLVGAWQLLFGDGIPAYAALNETVEAARRTRAAQPAFVNGVLRNVARNLETIRAELAAAPLPVRTSHPEALVARWRTFFGEETAAALCEAGRGIPPVTAFAVASDNGAGADAARALAARWRDAGIDCPDPPAGRDGPLVVPHGVAVVDLPGYGEGAFIVQDPAARATVADFLCPAPGETILDCCAAPGGKTIQIAAAVGPGGHVVALDNAESRLGRLRDNLSRTGLAGRVEVACCDAASPELVARFGKRRFDAILVDAPCSNSGVFARRPDARWRWSEQEVLRLAQVQREILRNVACLGARRIVYSTCSIDRAENDEVAAAFPEESGGAYVPAGSRTLLPLVDSPDFGRFLPPSWHDGAFAARFENCRETSSFPFVMVSS